jgi:hypothetical protein
MTVTEDATAQPAFSATRRHRAQLVPATAGVAWVGLCSRGEYLGLSQASTSAVAAVDVETSRNKGTLWWRQAKPRLRPGPRPSHAVGLLLPVIASSALRPVASKVCPAVVTAPSATQNKPSTPKGSKAVGGPLLPHDESEKVPVFRKSRTFKRDST